MKKEVQMTDEEFMAQPDKWPAWPVLPVKKRGQFEVGVMVEFDGGVKPIVYLTNIFEMDLAHCEVKSYPDFQGVVDDGWVVD